MRERRETGVMNLGHSWTLVPWGNYGCSIALCTLWLTNGTPRVSPISHAFAFGTVGGPVREGHGAFISL